MRWGRQTASLMFAPRQPTEISNPIATARARLHIAFMWPAQNLGCCALVPGSWTLQPGRNGCARPLRHVFRSPSCWHSDSWPPRRRGFASIARHSVDADAGIARGASCCGRRHDYFAPYVRERDAGRRRQRARGRTQKTRCQFGFDQCALERVL